ncbi:MAG: hypothetical protein IJ640_01205 [Prevotella sp.]|nr:hypothetical protein [Prevotella sp.]
MKTGTGRGLTARAYAKHHRHAKTAYPTENQQQSARPDIVLTCAFCMLSA